MNSLGKLASAALLTVCVVAAAAGCSPPVAAEPSSTSSGSVPPSAAPTPTPTPVEITLGGDCSSMLSIKEASEILGEEVEQQDSLVPPVAATIGGIYCTWASLGQERTVLALSAFPLETVPLDVLELDGVSIPCVGAQPCEYGAAYGDAWVVASVDSSLDMNIRAVEKVGPRAAEQPGSASPLGSEAWAVPDCDDVRAAASQVLKDNDVRPYAGDVQPRGQQWEILSNNGAAGWCMASGNGDETSLDEIEVVVWPGRSQIGVAVSAENSATPIDVAGATTAYLTERRFGDVFVIAATDANSIRVGARVLDEDQLVALTAALIAFLDG